MLARRPSQLLAHPGELVTANARTRLRTRPTGFAVDPPSAAEDACALCARCVLEDSIRTVRVVVPYHAAALLAAPIGVERFADGRAPNQTRGSGARHLSGLTRPNRAGWRPGAGRRGDTGLHLNRRLRRSLWRGLWGRQGRYLAIFLRQHRAMTHKVGAAAIVAAPRKVPLKALARLQRREPCAPKLFITPLPLHVLLWYVLVP